MAGEKEARGANPLYADLQGNSSGRNFPHLGATPPNPPKSRKRRVVSLDFTERDYEALRKEAERLGFKLRTFCRRAILQELNRTKNLPPAQELRKAYRELAYQLRKWGVLMNQVARHANKHKAVDEWVLERLESIDRKLTKLLREVEP